MYSDWVWELAGLVILLWLGILSFLIWQQSRFIKSLFPKSNERDIRKKFDEVVAAIDKFDKDLVIFNDRLGQIESAGLKHIQRVKLLRFNPYDETGGDQSFSVAALDGNGTGFVLTSLHARSGTRVFAKPVVEGKSDQYQLSKEEESVVKEVISQKK